MIDLGLELNDRWRRITKGGNTVDVINTRDASAAMPQAGAPLADWLIRDLVDGYPGTLSVLGPPGSTSAAAATIPSGKRSICMELSGKPCCHRLPASLLTHPQVRNEAMGSVSSSRHTGCGDARVGHVGPRGRVDPVPARMVAGAVSLAVLGGSPR